MDRFDHIFEQQSAPSTECHTYTRILDNIRQICQQYFGIESRNWLTIGCDFMGQLKCTSAARHLVVYQHCNKCNTDKKKNQSKMLLNAEIYIVGNRGKRQREIEREQETICLYKHKIMARGFLSSFFFGTKQYENVCIQ